MSRTGTTTIQHLLENERIHSTQIEGQLYYSAADVVGVLSECMDGVAEWEELKQVEPALRSRCVTGEVGGEVQDLLSLGGVMRLIQVVDSPRADRLRGWIADVAAQHVQEEADPELGIQRLRQGYVGRGRTRRWIDQRLRAISARQEIVGEWYRRGITQSEQFRELTNKLMESTFGMNVQALRQSKGFTRNLRDHLTDLELALLSLAETTAAGLHRARNSEGVEQCLRDVADAGKIVSETRRRIEQATMEGVGGVAA